MMDHSLVDLYLVFLAAMFTNAALCWFVNLFIHTPEEEDE